MGRSLALEATDEQILGLVDEWVERLAKDRYEDAFDLIPATPPWTPSRLKAVIESGGSPIRRESEVGLRVASPSTAGLTAAQARRVRRWGDPTVMESLGHVEYDLPLDGQWPEKEPAVSSSLRLTALFDVKLRDQAVAAEFFDLQLCHLHPNRWGTGRRFHLLRFRILQQSRPIPLTRQPPLALPAEISGLIPDRDLLQKLIAEQFKRPKRRLLPSLTDYDATVLDVERVDDAGFFQTHVVLRVHVEGSFLEWHPLPSLNSIGLFAWDGMRLRYLNRKHPENFELVLRAEGRSLHEASLTPWRQSLRTPCSRLAMTRMLFYGHRTI